jgi:hypothetical protein
MQGLGQGSIGLGHKYEPTAGPPFVPGAARNGASVDAGGFIVLGSDVGSPAAGKLLNDRVIDMDGNNFTWKDGAATIFDIDRALGIIMLGQKTGVNVRNGFEIRNNNDITAYLNLQRYLSLSATNSAIGDLDFIGNGSQLQINDAPVQFIMESFNGGTPQPYLFLDKGTQTYKMGDMNAIDNGNHLIIDDAASNFQLKTVSSRIMDLQSGSFVTQLGDIDGFAGGLIETVSDLANSHDVSNTANTAFYSINGNPGVSGTFTPPLSITVEGGIITAIS